MENEINIVQQDSSNYHIESINKKGQLNIITKKQIVKSLSYLPHIDLDKVIGRDHDVQSVISMLDESGKVILVNGIGGIGKTTLAKAIIAREKEQFKHIAWVNVISTVKEAFVSNVQLVENLYLDFEHIPKDESFTDRAFDLVINRLRQLSGNNLLIIDNAQQDIGNQKIITSLKLERNWKVLVTSRQHLPGFKIYPLGFLSKTEAVNLFYLHYKLEKNDATLAILEAVGYHTLTIELIAKTAQSKQLTLAESIALLQEKGLDVAKDANIKFEHNSRKKTQDVFKYILAMFEIAGLSENEQWVIMQFAVLPSTYIHFINNNDKNISNFLQCDARKEKDELANAINNIVQNGWLNWDENKDTFWMHNILQEVVREIKKPNAEDCFLLINSLKWLLYEKLELNPIHASALLPYSEKVLENIALSNEEIASLANNTGEALRHLGKLEKAADYMLKSIDVKENKLGEIDESLASSYNNLSLILNDLGKFDESISYSERALKIRKKHARESQLALAQNYNNLAIPYENSGDIKTSLKLSLKALKIRKKQLDKDDLELANSYLNLGVTYDILGEYEKALGYKTKAVQIFEDKLDYFHPDLAQAYNNLAITYMHLLQYEKAIETNHKAIEIREKILPPDHSDLALSYDNIATTFGAIKNYKDAFLYGHKALEIRKKILPENHPDLATSHCNLGIYYRNTGNYDKALEHLLMGIEIEESSLSKNHLNLANSYLNLAILYFKTNDPAALLYHNKAYKIYANNFNKPPNNTHMKNLLEWKIIFEKKFDQ
ncbi:MAG: tetratricopeptide repeat protein [Bacteroidota bacterium]